MNNQIFRKKSLERIASPEQLDDYIKVSRPSLWLVLFSVLALLIALLVWSFTATLTSTMEVTGFAQDGNVVCYLTPEQSEELALGMRAQTEGAEGEIIEIGQNPVSQQEVAQDINDGYVFDVLAVPTWSVPVVLSVPDTLEGIVSLSIVTGTTHPAGFVLN